MTDTAARTPLAVLTWAQQPYTIEAAPIGDIATWIVACPHHGPIGRIGEISDAGRDRRAVELAEIHTDACDPAGPPPAHYGVSWSVGNGPATDETGLTYAGAQDRAMALGDELGFGSSIVIIMPPRPRHMTLVGQREAAEQAAPHPATGRRVTQQRNTGRGGLAPCATSVRAVARDGVIDESIIERVSTGRRTVYVWARSLPDHPAFGDAHRAARAAGWARLADLLRYQWRDSARRVRVSDYSITITRAGATSVPALPTMPAALIGLSVAAWAELVDSVIERDGGLYLADEEAAAELEAAGLAELNAQAAGVDGLGRLDRLMALAATPAAVAAVRTALDAQ